jgi:hypothetical protein
MLHACFGDFEVSQFQTNGTFSQEDLLCVFCVGAKLFVLKLVACWNVGFEICKLPLNYHLVLSLDWH